MITDYLNLFPIEQISVNKHPNRKKNNQYFTPEYIVEKAYSLIPSSKIKNIIDPAVGNGVFLKIASEKWSDAELFGIDIDEKVINEIKKFHLQNFYLFCSDSLCDKTWQIKEIKNIILNDGFDLVVGNPPFSSWFQRISNPQILSKYKLAYRNSKLMRSQAIEILFLELFISLCKTNGFIIIVLPDGILSNPQYQYIRKYILEETVVNHIISLPRNVFEHTSAKTSILILQRKRNNNLNYQTVISHLENFGVINNSIKVHATDLVKRMDHFYYYNLRNNSIKLLIEKGIEFKPLKEFVIYCKTGKTLYGKDRKFSDKGIKFLHATNVTDIGINYKLDEKFIDPTSKMYFPSAYARLEDILFVRVGVGCSGRVAIVDCKENEGIASDYLHIFKVKNINPYFLVVYLKTKFGKDSINLLKHGVGTISINKTDLLSIPVPIIQEQIQTDIEKKYKKVLEEYRNYLEIPDAYLNKKFCDLISYVETMLLKIGEKEYVEV